MPHASKWIQPAHGRLRGSACEGRTCSAYQCDTRGCYAVTGRVQWERFARVGRCSALLDGCLRAAHPGAKGSPSRSSYTPVCKAQFVDRVAACKFGVKVGWAWASPEDLDSVLSLLANRYSKVLRAQVETTDRCLVTIGSECGLLNPWLVDWWSSHLIEV